MCCDGFSQIAGGNVKWYNHFANLLAVTPRVKHTPYNSREISPR